MIKINNLYSSYGTIKVLHDINFEIRPSEFFTIIGSNGAGKSTLLKSIAGVHNLTSGNMIFNGNLINKLSANQRVKDGISLVPEGRRVFPKLSVLENIELGAYTCSDKKEIQNRMNFVHELFPILYTRKKQYAGTLSGGEQQMLAISRSLMSNPKLLLLDEPSMGIAPILVDKIFDSLITLNKKNKVTILLVEQNAKIALSITDRALVLDLGKIILEGESSKLINDPRIVEAYLSGDS